VPVPGQSLREPPAVEAIERKPSKPPQIFLEDEPEPEAAVKVREKVEDRKIERPRLLEKILNHLDALLPLSSGSQKEKDRAEEHLYALIDHATHSQLLKGLLPDGHWEADIPNASDLEKKGILLDNESVAYEICQKVETIRQNLGITIVEVKPIPMAINLKSPGRASSVNFDKICTTPRSPKLSIDIARCDLAILRDYLTKNEEKRYLYKILYCLHSLREFSKNNNLCLAELTSLKNRLNLLTLIKPYQTRNEPEMPQELDWPPLEKLTGSPRIKSQIARLYYDTYASILSNLASQIQQAKKSCDVVSIAEISSILTDSKLFNFPELLTYSVVTGHLDLLQTCIPKFDKHVVKEIEFALDFDGIKWLHFMIQHAQESYMQIHPLLDNLVLLYDLNEIKDAHQREPGKINLPAESIEALQAYQRNGGNVLSRKHGTQAVLHAYANSRDRNPEVLDEICRQAEASVQDSLKSMNVNDVKQILEIANDLHTFAEAKIPAKFAQSIIKMIDELKMKCNTAQVTLPKEAVDLLNQL
jgi:hypothetical protein